MKSVKQRDYFGKIKSFCNRRSYQFSEDLEYRKIPNEFRGAILNYNHRNNWIDTNDYVVNEKVI
jgi:hypothetical protein